MHLTIWQDTIIHTSKGLVRSLHLAHRFDSNIWICCSYLWKVDDTDTEISFAAGVTPVGITQAILWLRHCQRFGLTHGIRECELEIAHHYRDLFSNNLNPRLLDLDSESIFRISKAYIYFTQSSLGGNGNYERVRNFFESNSKRAPWN